MSAAAYRIRKWVATKMDETRTERPDEYEVWKRALEAVDNELEREAERQFTRPIGGALDDPRTIDQTGALR